MTATDRPGGVHAHSGLRRTLRVAEAVEERAV